LQNNCFSSIQLFLKSLIEEFIIEFPDKVNDLIDPIISATQLTTDIGSKIEKIWKRKEIKDLYKEYENQLQVPSCSPFYWENAKRIANDNFVPDKEDVIRAKFKTVGIFDLKIRVENINYIFVDVGGQRSERRKWIHQFHNVNAIIYLTAIDEYDGKTLEEAKGIDRLNESLNLFEKLSGIKWFADIPFILFLNKSDLFREKIERKPLSVRFNDYDDYVKSEAFKSDYDASISYLSQLFRNYFRGKTNLYVFDTCAIDGEIIRKVFTSLRHSILERRLQNTITV